MKVMIGMTHNYFLVVRLCFSECHTMQRETCVARSVLGLQSTLQPSWEYPPSGAVHLFSKSRSLPPSLLDLNSPIWRNCFPSELFWKVKSLHLYLSLNHIWFNDIPFTNRISWHLQLLLWFDFYTVHILSCQKKSLMRRNCHICNYPYKCPEPNFNSWDREGSLNKQFSAQLDVL